MSDPLTPSPVDGGAGRLISARWPFWLALTVCCISGGAAAFFTTRPLYRSEALVAIRPRPTSPDVFAPDAKWVIERHVSVMQSPSFLDGAMRNVAWTSANSQNGSSRARQEFREAFGAFPTSGNLIHLWFDHADRRIAQAGTSAVVGELVGRASVEDRKRVEMLGLRKAMLGGHIARLDAAIGMRKVTDTESAKLKIGDLARQRTDLGREQNEVQERIDHCVLQKYVTQVQAPTLPVIDRRARNTLWGALGGIVVFWVVLVLARASRRIRQTRSSRTAFPVVMPGDPKPVIELADETSAAPARS